MKFSIETEPFIEALQLVAGAVEKRQTLPVLSNVLLEAREGVVRLTGTDLEVELSTTIPLDNMDASGDITLPAKKLLDIVKSLSAEKTIELFLQEGRMILKSGRSRFTLSTLPAADFPHVEEGVGTLNLSIPCPVLSDMIDRTHFAMAQQDVRYYLNGMFFQLEDKSLQMVATDGHRLAMAEYKGVDEEITQGIIVPRKGMLELGRLVSGRSDNVELTLGTNHIKLEVDQIRFTSKLIDGKFPDYNRVIPRNTDKTIVVEKSLLKEGLQRAAILSNEKFKGVRLMVSSQTLTLLSNNPEQEEAEIEVPAEVEGDELEIGFNVQYLIDVVNSCRVEKIKIMLGDVNSSCMIQEVEGSEALYVIMPMRL